MVRIRFDNLWCALYFCHGDDQHVLIDFPRVIFFIELLVSEKTVLLHFTVP